MIFHLIICILLFTRDSFAKIVNEKCFLAKIFFIFLIIIFLLFVDNSYLIYYVKISSFISVIFLIYQSIILIDFGYIWNETWVEKYQNGTTFYGILLIIFSILLAGATIGMVYVNFNNFWLENCWYNKINLILNIIIIIVIVILVLLKLNNNSSILTAFLITLIFSYLNGISMSSLNDRKCNPFQAKDTKYQEFVYGFCFYLSINLLLGYITATFVSVSEKSSDIVRNANLIAVHRVHTDENNTSTISEEMGLKESETSTLPLYQTNNFILFHLMMVFLSIYLVMIFFDWKQLNLDFDSWKEITNNSSSGFWIKTLNSFLFLGIYIWTLVAPYFLSNREFN